MSVRPNQIGYLTGVPSAFNTQSTQFPYMLNPSCEVSQREQMLQNHLLQERQQYEAWKAQLQVSQMQAPPIVSSGPTVCEKVKIDDDVEVISVRSASTKRARPRDQATVTVLKRVNPVHQHPTDPSLPAGTTLEGLAQSQGHLRPVLNMPRTDLYMPKT